MTVQLTVRRSSTNDGQTDGRADRLSDICVVQHDLHLYYVVILPMLQIMVLSSSKCSAYRRRYLFVIKTSGQNEPGIRVLRFTTTTAGETMVFS